MGERIFLEECKTLGPSTFFFMNCGMYFFIHFSFCLLSYYTFLRMHMYTLACLICCKGRYYASCIPCNCGFGLSRREYHFSWPPLHLSIPDCHPTPIRAAKRQWMSCLFSQTVCNCNGLNRLIQLFWIAFTEKITPFLALWGQTPECSFCRTDSNLNLCGFQSRRVKMESGIQFRICPLQASTFYRDQHTHHDWSIVAFGRDASD